MTAHARTQKAIRHLTSLGYGITPPAIVTPPSAAVPAAPSEPFKGNVGRPRPVAERAEAVKGK